MTKIYCCIDYVIIEGRVSNVSEDGAASRAQYLVVVVLLYDI
jgi:hypothetical protein